MKGYAGRRGEEEEEMEMRRRRDRTDRERERWRRRKVRPARRGWGGDAVATILCEYLLDFPTCKRATKLFPAKLT